MENWPIFDLHADLLSCVGPNEGAEGFLKEGAKCSLKQLWDGGVRTQVFTLFTPTERGSVHKGLDQLGRYHYMLKAHPKWVRSIRQKTNSLDKDPIYSLLAVENASAFAKEDEDLDLVWGRLNAIVDAESILYISLTWKEENRFGGGDLTSIGLKPDGKALLEFISGMGIAIDLSHTSDPLAYDILSYIDQRSLQISVIASHSNMRSVCAHHRNLPDELIQEIVWRQGLIGLSFVKKFIGDRLEMFIDHIHHLLDLGGESVIALGADFFGGPHLPGADLISDDIDGEFFEKMPDASQVSHFFEGLKNYGFSEELLQKIQFGNAHRFYQRELTLKSF